MNVPSREAAAEPFCPVGCWCGSRQAFITMRPGINTYLPYACFEESEEITRATHRWIPLAIQHWLRER